MLARALAERCRHVQQAMLDAGEDCDSDAAEGRVFAEFLASDAAREVDWTALYPQFLGAFAPERQRALGVYYTPAEVVRAQVRLAADLLQHRLGCATAFADPRVLVVDPAAGSGAYPIEVVTDVIARCGRIPPALAQRIRVLEPLAGAASIARARLAAVLGSADGLTVEERNILDEPLRLSAPVVVCLGNPPYRRHRRTIDPGRRRWRSGVEDFQEPGAGLHAKNLYNDYVYFWRWALRTVFEQRRGPGIVSFVTASSYLRGPGFGGMRERLRRSLDELWIVDLEGDHLAARRTDNVFPIRTPVAIAMGVRYDTPAPHQPAVVHYARLDGPRPEKLAALDAVHELTDVPWRSTSSGWALPLVPPARGDYARWPKLTDIFPRQLSGAQLKRTWPIAPTPAVLRERWDRLLDLPASGSARATAFRETRDRDLDSTPSDLCEPTQRLEALRSLAPGAACIEPVPYAYRSFDRQWVLPDARLGDFMRPSLWRVAGPRQIFLTSLLTNVLGAGPAAVATALVPDLDCFRGSFGARAVIPLWCDAQALCPNIAEGLLEHLAAHYGRVVRAEDLLAYCYALLGTRGFQTRFEEELRTPGPRVPLTRDAVLFLRAAALGGRLLWLHTYGQRGVGGGVLAGQACCLAPVGLAYPRQYRYDPERQTLHVGEGSFGPVTQDAWEFSVSGLRVIAAWLGRRVAGPAGKPRRSSPLDAIEPRAWTSALTHELLELIWVLEATLTMQPALDELLGEVIATQAAATNWGPEIVPNSSGTASG